MHTSPPFWFRLICLFCFFSVEAAHAQKYTLTDLGSLGGKYVSPAAISSNGIVVGSSTIAGDDTSYSIFSWEKGVMTEVGPLGRYPEVFGVNSSDQIVGSSEDSITGHDQAFLYDPGGAPYPIASAPSAAYAINEAGDVVGYYEPNGGVQHPFIFSDGTLEDINVDYGSAVAINNKGQVLIETSVGEALIYSNGVLTKLGKMEAVAINDKGQTIGRRGLSCYLATDGKPKTFSSFYPKGPCQPLALNNFGTVVGGAGLKGSTRYDGFIFRDGIFSDLNTVSVGPLAPFVSIGFAVGINDSGQIAAVGNDSRHLDEIHAYLLDPVAPISLSCPAGSAEVGATYDSRVVSTGGVEPYVFSITSGALPNGLRLDAATGVVSGVPTSAAQFHFLITVTDSSGDADGSATQSCAISVAPRQDTSALQATPSKLTFGPVNHYSSQIKEITLANLGKSAIRLSPAIVTPGAGTAAHVFSSIDRCGDLLLPGASCFIYVVFVAEESGTLSGTLAVPNTSGETVAIGLSASVTDDSLAILDTR